MVCRGLEIITDDTIVGLLSFPTSCHYYFYGEIMFAFWLIVALSLFRLDEDRFIKPDFLSASGVSAAATIFVSLMGTLLGIIPQDIFIYIFTLGMVLIAIWILKK